MTQLNNKPAGEAEEPEILQKIRLGLRGAPSSGTPGLTAEEELQVLVDAFVTIRAPIDQWRELLAPYAAAIAAEARAPLVEALREIDDLCRNGSGHLGLYIRIAQIAERAITPPASTAQGDEDAR